MAGLFTACPLPTSPSNTARSATPAAEEDDSVVVKTQRIQDKAAFTLSTTANGVWKVYGEAAGGSPLFDVEAEFAPPRLTLQHKTDVEAGTYWVTVTQPGRAESDRLKLKVKAYNVPGAAETPETEVPRAVKAEEVQAAVDFTLTSSYTGAWKVYSTAAGGRPVTGITASFAAPVLTLSHASDVPAGTYWVTVKGSETAESGRLKLTVEAFTAAGASKTPAADVPSIAKVSDSQSAVTFELTTTHTGEWKLYDAASGGSPLEDIHAVFEQPNKLTLLQIPEVRTAAYWVTVTERGKGESGRLKLRVEAYTPEGKTKTPTADVTRVPKNRDIQPRVEFPLTSFHEGVWKVYRDEDTGVPLGDVTVSFDDPLLTLEDTLDIEAGDYWVSVTEAPLTESGRLKLTVLSYDPTETPTAAEGYSRAAMTQANQAAVTFTLTSTVDGEWNVYDAAAGGSPRADITASFAAPALTLGKSGGIPAGTYWVTVTKPGKTESGRLKLIVGAYTEAGKTQTPGADVTWVLKSGDADVTFMLNTTVDGEWKVYDTETAGAPRTDIEVWFDATELTLRTPGGVPAGTYWVTVTESGKTESGRLKLIVQGPAAIEAVTQHGGASALTNSNIKIVFNRALYPDLAASDVTVTGATPGAVTKDSGDASGASYLLRLTSIAAEGDITLTISRTDVSGSETVRVFKNVNHSQANAEATAAGLYAGDMTVPVQGLGNTNAGIDLLGKAFAWIKDHARENGKYRIVLGESIDSMTEKALDAAAFSSKTGAVITLAGDTAERTIQLSGTANLFKVSYGTLRLDNRITLKGIAGNTNSNTAVVCIETDGTLIMETGSKITGNTAAASQNTSGVRMTGGTFTMNGGEISGNKAAEGGGVLMTSNNETPKLFTMSGGSITGNQGAYGGGVHVQQGGTFTMTGGSITNNNSSGSIAVQGGGIWVGTVVSVKISGGEISNNKAPLGGGVFVNAGPFTMEGGVIKGNQATGTSASQGFGGGVNLRHPSAFTKTGGIIYGNNASSTGDKNTTAAANRGAAVAVFNNSSTDPTLIKALENTVDAAHNLTKASADDTAGELTAEKGW
jgi:hypothetical protein